MFSVWREVEFPQILKNISQCVCILLLLRVIVLSKVHFFNYDLWSSQQDNPAAGRQQRL